MKKITPLLLILLAGCATTKPTEWSRIEYNCNYETIYVRADRGNPKLFVRVNGLYEGEARVVADLTLGHFGERIYWVLDGIALYEMRTAIAPSGMRTGYLYVTHTWANEGKPYPLFELRCSTRGS